MTQFNSNLYLTNKLDWHDSFCIIKKHNQYLYFVICIVFLKMYFFDNFIILLLLSLLLMNNLNSCYKLLFS